MEAHLQRPPSVFLRQERHSIYVFILVSFDSLWVEKNMEEAITLKMKKTLKLRETREQNYAKEAQVLFKLLNESEDVRIKHFAQ